MLKTELLKTEIFRDYSDKDLVKEEEEIRFSLLENPQNIENLKSLAAILYYKRDYNGAIKLYEKIVNTNPENADYAAFLGYLYYENENYENAIDYFNKSLEIAPDNSFAHFLLGNTYSRAGLIKEAINSYDFAIFLDLDIYTAHLDFAKKI